MLLSNEQTKVVIIICGNEIRLDDREDEKASRNPGMLLLLDLDTRLKWCSIEMVLEDEDC